jgi:hypothetical protein
MLRINPHMTSVFCEKLPNYPGNAAVQKKSMFSFIPTASKQDLLSGYAGFGFKFTFGSRNTANE